MKSHEHPDTFALWPDGFQAMLSLEAAMGETDLDPRLVELVKIRCSELNACSYCTRLHQTLAGRLGVDDATVREVATWAGSASFSDPERAALAVADALTRPDSGDLDAAVATARAHFDDTQLAQLVYTVAAINAWNRLAIIQIQPDLA